MSNHRGPGGPHENRLRKTRPSLQNLPRSHKSSRCLQILSQEHHTYLRTNPDTTEKTIQMQPAFTSLSHHPASSCTGLAGSPQTSMIDDRSSSIHSRSLSDPCAQNLHEYHRGILDTATENFRVQQEPSLHLSVHGPAHTCAGLSLFLPEFADRPSFKSLSSSSRERFWRAETYFTRQGFHSFQTCARTTPRTDPPTPSCQYRSGCPCTASLSHR